MKSIAKLLFILIAGTLFSCSSDEPNKNFILGDASPLEFDYRDIDFRVEIIKGLTCDLKDYYGKIPAEGDTFYITHEYQKLLGRRKPQRSIVGGLYINGQLIDGLSYIYIPDDGIEFKGEWGYIETKYDKNLLCTMKVVINKNDTGAPRNFIISLRFLSAAVAGIYLTQESL